MNTVSKTLIMAITLALTASAAAMASDHEVTIRVMQMNQQTQQQLLNQIELPDYANDDARVLQREQIRKNLRQRDGEPLQSSLGDGERGDDANDGFYDRDRDRTRDQDRTHQLENELQQQHIENQFQQQQELHEHNPGGSQNGPGRQ